jgi:hypothetical protein
MQYNSEDLAKIEIALAYAAHGLAVFPCHTLEANGVCSCSYPSCDSVAKHPLTDNGVKAATKDVQTLTNDFGGEYDAANIAIATGEPSGVCGYTPSKGRSVTGTWEVRFPFPRRRLRPAWTPPLPLPLTPTAPLPRRPRVPWRTRRGCRRARPRRF